MSRAQQRSDGAGSGRRDVDVRSIAANVLVALGAWVGFYQHVTWAAVLTAAVIWLNAAAHVMLLAREDANDPPVQREPPMWPWLWNLFDVLIAAELLAAEAHATAFGWMLAIVLQRGMTWRAPNRARPQR